MKSVKLTIELFGGLRVKWEGHGPVVLPPRQASLVLAFLALQSNRAYTRDELCAAFWPDDGAEEARQKLRHSLHVLRGQLKRPEQYGPEVLQTTRASVQLNPEAVQTDVGEFELKLLAAAHAINLPERIELLSGALALYRGELLPGFYEESILAARDRLEEARRAALHNLALAYEQADEPERALACARECIALNPLMSEVHCDLMRLYAATGQPTAVLRQFQEMKRALRDDLGIDVPDEARALRDSQHREGQRIAAIRAGSAKPTDSLEADQPKFAGNQTSASSPDLVRGRRRQSHRTAYRAWAVGGAVIVLLSCAAFLIKGGRPLASHANAKALLPADGIHNAAAIGKRQWQPIVKDAGQRLSLPVEKTAREPDTDHGLKSSDKPPGKPEPVRLEAFALHPVTKSARAAVEGGKQLWAAKFQRQAGENLLRTTMHGRRTHNRGDGRSRKRLCHRPGGGQSCN